MHESYQHQSEIDRLAVETLMGCYGNGQERKERLGDKYEEVQLRVNELLMEEMKKYEIKRTIANTLGRIGVAIITVVLLIVGLICAGDAIFSFGYAIFNQDKHAVEHGFACLGAVALAMLLTWPVSKLNDYLAGEYDGVNC